jgi:hypothetical protein
VSASAALSTSCHQAGGASAQTPTPLVRAACWQVTAAVMSACRLWAAHGLRGQQRQSGRQQQGQQRQQQQGAVSAAAGPSTSCHQAGGASAQTPTPLVRAACWQVTAAVMSACRLWAAHGLRGQQRRQQQQDQQRLSLARCSLPIPQTGTSRTQSAETVSNERNAAARRVVLLATVAAFACAVQLTPLPSCPPPLSCACAGGCSCSPADGGAAAAAHTGQGCRTAWAVACRRWAGRHRPGAASPACCSRQPWTHSSTPAACWHSP